MADARPSRFRAAISVLSRVVLALVVIGLAPLARFDSFAWSHEISGGWARAELAVILAALAVTAVSYLPGRLIAWALVPPVALGAFAYVRPVDGTSVAALLAFTVVMAAWGICRIRPIWFLRRPDGSAIPGLLVLSVAAAYLLRSEPSVRRGAILVAAMAVPTALSLPYRPSRWVQRSIGQFARRVGAVVSVVLFAVASVPVVIAPWLAQRITRWNPVRASSPGGWLSMEPAALSGRRMWFGESQRGHVRVVQRAQALAASVLTLALVAPLAMVGWSALPSFHYSGRPPVVAPEGPEPPENVVRARILRTSWFTEMSRENQLAFDRGHLSQWAGTELGDVRGTYFNSSGGHRLGWKPGPPTCGRPLRVWMFGGSTTFSVAARDDNTVPSALAKRAYADGISLEMTNWGVPGDVAWQERQRMERAIENGSPRPDLVIFFDGFNDMSTVSNLPDDRARIEDFVGPLDRLHMAALTKLGSVNDGQHYVIDFPNQSAAKRSPAQVAAHAARQYLAADDSSRRLLESWHIPYVRFAQGSLWTRRTPVKGEPAADPQGVEIAKRFRRALPERIIDLGDMFKPSYGPIFNDDVHTDERGNRIIARELYRHLEATIRKLATKGGDTPCS